MLRKRSVNSFSQILVGIVEILTKINSNLAALKVPGLTFEDMMECGGYSVDNPGTRRQFEVFDMSDGRIDGIITAEEFVYIMDLNNP